MLKEHEPQCGKHGPQKIKMPSGDHDIMYFKDVLKQLKVPFVINADFESILVPCEQQNFNEKSKKKSSTAKTHEYQASGFCYIEVSEVEVYNTPPVVYRGENAT